MAERIDGHTLLIGLMAYPIRHSMSPTMHNNAFAKLGLNYAYLAFEVDNNNLADAVLSIKALDMRGSNVSMPNKQKIIPYLDRLDSAAEMCGAVNTVVNDNGVLTGYTTDGIGFVKALKNEGIDVSGKKMVITGAGGAGTPIAVQSALDGAAKIKIFNQEDDIYPVAQHNAQMITERTNSTASVHHLEDKDDFKEALASCDIYCDATNVGMGKLKDKTLVSDPSWFHKDMVVLDTVYSPRETKLMQVAQEAGVNHVFNGLEMMLEQGAAAFKLWTDEEMPVDYIRNLLFSED